jgi:hypothetical protein
MAFRPLGPGLPSAAKGVYASQLVMRPSVPNGCRIQPAAYVGLYLGMSPSNAIPGSEQALDFRNVPKCE